MLRYSLQVGIVKWEKDDGIAGPISLVAGEMGHHVIEFLASDKLPAGLDIILAYGSYRSWVPLINQLLAYPAAQRPVFILWLWEELPNPDLPDWLLYCAGTARSLLERGAYHRRENGAWVLKSRLDWLTSKASRLRYYGDLHWLRRAGLLSVLAVCSPWTGQYLRERGFNPFVTYLGAAAEWGGDLALVRDIPVLWIGKTGSNRRGRLLRQIRAELRRRGIEIFMVDGIEHPYVFGAERTALLNRTKVILNLLRQPWDDNSLRFYLAALNRALIVTEPTLPHTQFVPDQHLVETPIAKMADTICYYLSHEEANRRIVDKAYEMVTTEWTLSKVVELILKHGCEAGEITP
ncbi:MAG: glycosyltransferase family 1 protein [Chloroflexi bacterium]|nr:glycosyltransferase family 1 protein [Chloroflexota bacterium]